MNCRVLFVAVVIPKAVRVRASCSRQQMSLAASIGLVDHLLDAFSFAAYRGSVSIGFEIR